MADLNVTASKDSVPELSLVIDLYKERIHTLNELAASIAYFYQKPVLDLVATEQHLTNEIKPVLLELAKSLNAIDWEQENIHDAIMAMVTRHQLKFPKLAMPLRVMLTGIAQSPSIDQVMALLGKQETLNRIQNYIK